VGFTIDKDRKKMFEIKPLEIEPDNLKSIVANAPQGDQAIEVYLSRLVRAGKITTDDVTFLIDSGALQN
jgi:hypothetical protein